VHERRLCRNPDGVHRAASLPHRNERELFRWYLQLPDERDGRLHGREV
jgi:hypothetical protein